MTPTVTPPESHLPFLADFRRKRADYEIALEELRQHLRTLLIDLTSLGVTQAELADLLGVAQSRITAWKNRNIPVDQCTPDRLDCAIIPLANRLQRQLDKRAK